MHQHHHVRPHSTQTLTALAVSLHQSYTAMSPKGLLWVLSSSLLSQKMYRSCFTDTKRLPSYRRRQTSLHKRLDVSRSTCNGCRRVADCITDLQSWCVYVSCSVQSKLNSSDSVTFVSHCPAIDVLCLQMLFATSAYYWTVSLL